MSLQALGVEQVGHRLLLARGILALEQPWGHRGMASPGWSQGRLVPSCSVLAKKYFCSLWFMVDISILALLYKLINQLMINKWRENDLAWFYEKNKRTTPNKQQKSVDLWFCPRFGYCKGGKGCEGCPHWFVFVLFYNSFLLLLDVLYYLPVISSLPKYCGLYNHALWLPGHTQKRPFKLWQMRLFYLFGK